MKHAIVYDSKTGNTERLARAISDGLPKEDLVCLAPASSGAATRAADADVVFFGFWTDKGSCSSAAVAALSALEGKRVFLFGTAGFGASAEYFDAILQRVGSFLPESAQLIGSFMCQGEMPAAVRSHYERMQADQPERAKLLLDNFDAAVGHPTDDDRAALMDAVRSSMA